jgi:hypothetical protein
LARCLEALGAERPQRSGAERLFRFGRRLMGLRLKIMVLLAAEIVGVVFYEALAEGLGDGRISAALRHLVADEARHRRFHVAFLRQAFAWPLPAAWMWAAIGSAACMVVSYDHRRTFAALGISQRVILMRALRAIATTTTELGRSAS